MHPEEPELPKELGAPLPRHGLACHHRDVRTVPGVGSHRLWAPAVLQRITEPRRPARSPLCAVSKSASVSYSTSAVIERRW